MRMMAGIIKTLKSQCQLHPTPPHPISPSVHYFVHAPPLDFVTHAVIADNVISDCGLLDFEIDGDTYSKNGEGICEYHDYDARYGGNVIVLT